MNDEFLGEAVERLRRYTDKKLSVKPIAVLWIRGSFQASNVDAFVIAISTNYPVQTVRSKILLEPGDSGIIGATRDGGYYLLGLKTPHVQMFANIA